MVNIKFNVNGLSVIQTCVIFDDKISHQRLLNGLVDGEYVTTLALKKSTQYIKDSKSRKKVAQVIQSKIDSSDADGFEIVYSSSEHKSVSSFIREMKEIKAKMLEIKEVFNSFGFEDNSLTKVLVSRVNDLSVESKTLIAGINELGISGLRFSQDLFVSCNIANPIAAVRVNLGRMNSMLEELELFCDISLEVV